MHVDILTFESEEKLWMAAGVGARTADLNDCCVREVRRAAITPVDRHLLSEGVVERAWRRRPHSIAHQGRRWRRPVTGWTEEQVGALADGGAALSGGGPDVSSSGGSDRGAHMCEAGSDAGSFCAVRDGDMTGGSDAGMLGDMQEEDMGVEPWTWSLARAVVRAQRSVYRGVSGSGGSGSDRVDGVGASGDEGRCGGGSGRMRAVAEAVHAERRLPRGEQSSVEVWEERLRSAFAPPITISHREHVSGAHDWAADARGARVVHVADESRVPVAFGGELFYGLRATANEEAEGGWGIGDDGYRLGWQEIAAGLRGAVAFDSAGFPLVPVTGTSMGELELRALPPFLQLVCRARIEVGQVVVHERSPGKVFSTHVSLDVMAQNWVDACAWQARFGLTAAYATDAGTRALKDADGRTRFDDAGDPLAVVS